MPVPTVPVEVPYPVPSHLDTKQSFGPFPARFILPLMYTTFFMGVPLGTAAFDSTQGVLPAGLAAAMVPPLLLSPFMAWWLDPPFEHGALAASRFVKRAYVPAQMSSGGLVAAWRMRTINLETADEPQRRAARTQWGVVVNTLQYPSKTIIRGRPLTTLPAIEHLRNDPREVASELGEWLQQTIAHTSLVERDRLFIVPADDDAELNSRVIDVEKLFTQMKVDAVRIDPKDLPLLRTLTWNPRATEAEESPMILEEGTTEVHADGWWTRAYDLGKFPPRILTNWSSRLFNGDEPVDVAIDLVPKDPDDVQQWTLMPKINRLETSMPTKKRKIALDQLHALYDALEHRRVMPFDVGVTVLVRGNSRKDLRTRCRAVQKTMRSTGAKLHMLRWEQGAGLRQLDPTVTGVLWQRGHLLETGTVARTYPWSDNVLQIDGGVPWGEAGKQVCLFTPYRRGNKGPHMCWYGATEVGKGTGAHMLWSRMYLLQGIRIFGIDQDEQHEHCGRFLEYLGGRKLAPRDAKDAREIELHHDDGAVILDLSECDEDTAGEIFAEWVTVVKTHMLAFPGRSIVFIDEATRIMDNARAEKAMRQMFERSRHWGQSSHAMTQRPSTWFDTKVGRAVQGNADAWWCGGQLPRELSEVSEALELAQEEREYVRRAGIGRGLLTSGLDRVQLDLYEKLSPREYAAFHSDPVLEPQPIPASIRREIAV